MILDLTREIRTDTKVFPGSPLPKFITWNKMDIHNYHSEVMFMSTHTGTHMDAPSHFVSGVSSIDQIPVDRFISRATLIKVVKASDELITASEIQASKVEILEGNSVVFSTTWENEVDSDYYFSHSPGLSDDAAEYLINKKVNAVCIDSPSIDRGSDSNFPVHKLLLSKEILIVENLCNLSKINNQNFTLIMIPLKLSGASGSPIRAIATDQNFSRN
ncbi:MAG TPA: cyclase family protein [Nitrososphaeraceae archaeon]|jgi:kynurenine formamidase|nr:cyclase family protein [Nitrososphaeraceae archaeon]